MYLFRGKGGIFFTRKQVPVDDVLKCRLTILVLADFQYIKMDKYTKVKIIGEGSFGRALLVRDKGSGQQFVVKEIPMLKMTTKEKEYATTEVAVLAQMNHPNIVRYIESFEENDNLHIVMNFCEKGDLYHKIRSRTALFSEDQIMDWFVQICHAIKYIHERKILHRDITTRNIFLTSGGAVQLGDFGIAKVLGSSGELSSTRIGTPLYFCPEICQNKPYNNKSDIWSLGCVLCELTTLKNAFAVEEMKDLKPKILSCSYQPASLNYSHELRGLIKKLLKREPKDRPSVDSILKMTFVQRSVAKIFTDDQIKDKFSPTTMHDKKIHNKMQPPKPRPRLSPASRPSAKGPKSEGPPRPQTPMPAAAHKTYKQANINGVPLGRRSDVGSLLDKNRPGIISGSRLGSNQDIITKTNELIEKEKIRDEIQKNIIKKRQEFIEMENKRKDEIPKALAKLKELKVKQKIEEAKARKMEIARMKFKEVINDLKERKKAKREKELINKEDEWRGQQKWHLRECRDCQSKPTRKPVFGIKVKEPKRLRSRWSVKMDDRLKDLPLQETASSMEVTSARDKVIRNPGNVGPRGAWAQPGSTITNALKNMSIIEGESTTSDRRGRFSGHNKNIPSFNRSTEAKSKPGFKETTTATKPPIYNDIENILATKTQSDFTKPKHLTKSPTSETVVDPSKCEPIIALSSESTQLENSKENIPEEKSSKGKLSKSPVGTVQVEKPLVLPTPTLLAKPDSPMTFGKEGQVLKAVNVMGEGSLFRKLEPELEDSAEKACIKQLVEDNLTVEEFQDDTPIEGKSDSEMAVALTTGPFEMRNTWNDDLVEHIAAEVKGEPESDKQNVEENDDDAENEVDIDDEEYEELESVRESMARLLLRTISTDSI